MFNNSQNDTMVEVLSERHRRTLQEKLPLSTRQWSPAWPCLMSYACMTSMQTRSQAIWKRFTGGCYIGWGS